MFTCERQWDAHRVVRSGEALGAHLELDLADDGGDDRAELQVREL